MLPHHLTIYDEMHIFNVLKNPLSSSGNYTNGCCIAECL